MDFVDTDHASSGPKSNTLLSVQATEDVSVGLPSATSVPAIRPTRPSAVRSSKDDDTGSPIHKLQRHVNKMWKTFSAQPEMNTTYNPEVLTSQKRQWTRFQSKSMVNRVQREPSRIFESMVIVGLHPLTDMQALEELASQRNNEELKKTWNLFGNHQVHAESSVEPQVLFAYPPKKPLPLKYRDLLSFCLPGGVQVRAVERTPSCSELNEILLGQEQLDESNQSFVFRLQVADDSTLYGCCILVEEIVQKPSNLVSMLIGEKLSFPSLSRNVLTTPRCYCLLSRLPFFELHFGVLRSILSEERLERLMDGVGMLKLFSLVEAEKDCEDSAKQYSPNSSVEFTESSGEALSSKVESENCSSSESTEREVEVNLEVVHSDDNATNEPQNSYVNVQFVVGEDDENNGHEVVVSEQFAVPLLEKEASAQERFGSDGQKHLDTENAKSTPPDGVLSLLRCCICGSSEPPTSFSDSNCEERDFRILRPEEPSFIGDEAVYGQADVLQWAKAKKCASLQIICEYYLLVCPSRGSSVTFQPLEHLQPLKFHRPSETILNIAGSTVDVRSYYPTTEMAEVHNALFAEEESSALSVWAVACICGCLRLEHVLALFAAALLEKQIVICCSNLGILTASVLSLISIIRPYQWQSLLMPILPDDMLEFLDAPVPYIVGVQNKTADVQSRLSHAIVVDANKNQVKSVSIPQLPQLKELLSALRPYHSKLVGESYLARKRPIYACTDVQAEASKGFLAVLRAYLDSLCSNLRSHTITNVQSNNDKVSLLLKESFIGSFPSRDRPFMKLFVDTQLFSVHTDLVLSFYQKD